MRTIAAWVVLGLGFALLFNGHDWLAGLAIVAWLFLLNQHRGTIMTPEELARERHASAQRRMAAKAAEPKHVAFPREPMGRFGLLSRAQQRKLRDANDYLPPKNIDVMEG